MKTCWTFILLAIAAGLLASAQGRATMETPVIRGMVDKVTFSTRFSDFAAGSEYRIGVGGAKATLNGLEMELSSEDSGVLSHPTVSFTQGYTSSWWSVDEVRAEGFLFEKSTLDGKTLTLRVEVPRDAAESAGRIFVFVAKKYSPTTWYLEDGAALTSEYW